MYFSAKPKGSICLLLQLKRSKRCLHVSKTIRSVVLMSACIAFETVHVYRPHIGRIQHDNFPTHVHGPCLGLLITKRISNSIKSVFRGMYLRPSCSHIGN